MSEKPVVLVGRKLPDAVEARLSRDYQPRLNPDDRLYTGDELIALAQGAAAILPCHTEHLTAAVIAQLPASVRAICNYSVGGNWAITAAEGVEQHLAFERTFQPGGELRVADHFGGCAGLGFLGLMPGGLPAGLPLCSLDRAASDPPTWRKHT